MIWLIKYYTCIFSWISLFLLRSLTLLHAAPLPLPNEFLYLTATKWLFPNIRALNVPRHHRTPQTRSAFVPQLLPSFADLGQTWWILCKKTEREGCSSDHMITIFKSPPIEDLGISITAEQLNHTKRGGDVRDVWRHQMLKGEHKRCMLYLWRTHWSPPFLFSLPLPVLTLASWHFLYPQLFPCAPRCRILFSSFASQSSDLAITLTVESLRLYQASNCLAAAAAGLFYKDHIQWCARQQMKQLQCLSKALIPLKLSHFFHCVTTNVSVVTWGCTPETNTKQRKPVKWKKNGI